MNYYDIFEVEPRLALDTGELRQRFYTLSRKYHPDRNPQALEKSALLNDAFRTLRDPVARAAYVLEEQGLEINIKDVPPELLETVFEFNMALEDSDARQLASFRAQFETMLGDIDSQMQGEFEQWDSGRSGETLLRIRALLNRRKFISNLIRSIDQSTNGHLPN